MTSDGGTIQNFKSGLRNWGNILRRALLYFIGWGVRQVIGFLIAVAIVALQVYYGLFTWATIKTRWLSIAWPYLGCLSLAYLFNIARAAWQTHEEKKLEIEALKASHREAIKQERQAHRIIVNEHMQMKRAFTEDIHRLKAELGAKGG